MQAKFHQEQQCQQLQQRAAGLSGKVHSLTGRCEDAEADAQALQHRLSLEAERVCFCSPRVLDLSLADLHKLKHHPIMASRSI